MKTIFPLLASAMLLTSCATTANVQYPSGPARIGQTVFVDGPLVRPDKVVEDSRCPADVDCVWAGRLVLLATVTTGPGARQMTLELGRPVHVADGTLTLVSVEPQRYHQKPGETGEYRFSFKFEGGF